MLRKRQDMVPMLVEVFKKHLPSDKRTVLDAVKSRTKAYFDANDETMAEMDFSIKHIISHGEKSQKMTHDLYFLEMKKLLSENSDYIKHFAAEYNIAANSYNRFAPVFFNKKANLFNF